MTVEEWEQRLAACNGDPKEYNYLMKNRPKDIPANGIRVGNPTRNTTNLPPMLEKLQTGGK